MRLLGREITAEKVVARIEARLRERGLLEESTEPIQMSGVEPRVDPLSFNLRALEENVDPTVGLPLQTHRGGISGQSVIFVKQSFRRFGKIVINELLARQRVFNGHVLDSYAQLSAEVLRLREEVAKLKAVEGEKSTESEPGRTPPAQKRSKEQQEPQAEPKRSGTRSKNETAQSDRPRKPRSR